LKGRKAVDTDPLDLDNTCGKKKKNSINPKGGTKIKPNGYQKHWMQLISIIQRKPRSKLCPDLKGFSRV
jgi:hypothetical protein